MLLYVQILAFMRVAKGGEPLMSTNMNLLRGKLKERGVTQQELAQKIGMDSSTLSRKLASDGLKFTVGEMHDIAATLKLSANECKSIFLL